jgi:hypothetical protein
MRPDKVMNQQRIILKNFPTGSHTFEKSNCILEMGAPVLESVATLWQGVDRICR